MFLYFIIIFSENLKSGILASVLFSISRPTFVIIWKVSNPKKWPLKSVFS